MKVAVYTVEKPQVYHLGMAAKKIEGSHYAITLIYSATDETGFMKTESNEYELKGFPPTTQEELMGKYDAYIIL